MKLNFENKISQELVHPFNEEMKLKLAKSLVLNNYITLFDVLKNRHLMRALTINRTELNTNYPSPRSGTF